MKRGQISVTVAVISSIGLLAGSAITAWATSNLRLSEINTKVEVVQERENNHFTEIIRRLDTIDSKLEDLNANKQTNSNNNSPF